MKHKYQKGLVWSSVAMVLVLVGLTVGVVKGNYAYADERSMEERAGLIDDDDESGQAEELTAEEAERAAEKLVTTVRRLEATADYKKALGLVRAYECMYYDEAQSDNVYGCTERTNWDDVRQQLYNFVPKDRRDEIANYVNYETIEQFVPYFSQWQQVCYGVQSSVYRALRSQANADDDSGITAELTVENVAKAMQNTQSTLVLNRTLNDSYDNLLYFWSGLAILQADTLAEKMARFESQLTGTYWVQLVRSVYLAELYPSSYESLLVHYLSRYVDVRGMSLEQKLAAARDLSDWGQAKTLFDTIGMACDWFGENFYGWRGVCYEALAGLDEKTLNDLYTKASNAATILYPGMMKDIWNYKLVLAELPEDKSDDKPTVPNTGLTMLGEGELDDLAMVVVVAFGGVAIVIGGLVVGRMYLRKKF